MKRLRLLNVLTIAFALDASAAQVTVPAGASITLPGGSLSLACANLGLQGTMTLGASQVLTAGNVTVGAGATLSAGSSLLTVGGNWSNAGGFSAGTGTVVFTDGCTSAPATLSGATAFRNLTFTSLTGRTFVIPVGSAISVTGALSLAGTPGNPIQVTSATPGQAARIALAPGATYTSANAQLAAGVTVSPDGISPSAASLDFGGQSMNTTAPSQAVTFTNTGGAPVTVSSVTISTYFAVSHNCATVNAGASCTANVAFTPTAEGSLNGTLTVQSSAGPVTVPLAGTGERSLVTHYYRSILRRAPDGGGKAFWESEKVRLPSLGANVNETWYAMATFFYFSSEYQSFNRDDTGFVTDLYNTFFNRPADGGGLAFWTGLLSQGMPREVVLVSFMFSTEFQGFTQAIFGNVQARKEVDTVVDFYRGLLSRLPDDGGLASWVGQFRAAQCAGAGSVYTTVEAISSSFANGGEYASRNRTNAQYVGDLYNAFLRRGGDLGGVQFWISQLTGGATRSSIRQQFIASPEFTNRVNAIIAEGCVP